MVRGRVGEGENGDEPRIEVIVKLKKMVGVRGRVGGGGLRKGRFRGWGRVYS